MSTQREDAGGKKRPQAFVPPKRVSDALAGIISQLEHLSRAERGHVLSRLQAFYDRKPSKPLLPPKPKPVKAEWKKRWESSFSYRAFRIAQKLGSDPATKLPDADYDLLKDGVIRAKGDIRRKFLTADSSTAKQGEAHPEEEEASQTSEEWQEQVSYGELVHALVWWGMLPEEGRTKFVPPPRVPAELE